MVGLAAASIVALSARGSRADVPPSALTYRAAVECPGERAFRANVVAHIHEALPAAGGRVQIGIEALPGGYKGVLTAYDETGHVGRRDVDGKTCSGVADALAFLAALALQLGGRVEPEQPPPAPPVAPKPPRPPERPPPIVAIAPSGSGRLQISVLALESARGGFAPALRASAEVGIAAAATGGARTSARIVALAGQSQLQGADGGARLWFAGARAEVCPVALGKQAVTLRPCAGYELAAVGAHGYGVLDPRTTMQLWSAVEGSAQVDWNVTPSYFAEMQGAVAVPIAHTRYFFEPSQTLYTVPQVTPAARRGRVGRPVLIAGDEVIDWRAAHQPARDRNVRGEPL